MGPLKLFCSFYAIEWKRVQTFPVITMKSNSIGVCNDVRVTELKFLGEVK